MSNGRIPHVLNEGHPQIAEFSQSNFESTEAVETLLFKRLNQYIVRQKDLRWTDAMEEK